MASAARRLATALALALGMTLVAPPDAAAQGGRGARAAGEKTERRARTGRDTARGEARNTSLPRRLWRWASGGKSDVVLPGRPGLGKRYRLRRAARKATSDAVATALRRTGEDRLREVNDRKPINSEYAGERYPLDQLPAKLRDKYPKSVRFNKKGFPNFVPYARARVTLEGLTGDYDQDAAKANEAVGLQRTPDGYVWHHHQDGETLLLIPQDLHNAVPHTGGAAIIRERRANPGLLRRLLSRD